MHFHRAILFTALGFFSATHQLSAQTPMPPDVLKAQVETEMAALTPTYKHFHQHPELSHHEEKTSAYLAGELRKSGYEVTEHIGVYPDGSKAWGIVAVLANGAGPKVLIRTDMDALPIVEATAVDYASHEHAKNSEDQDVGVMHACGHDIHMTVLIGVARELARNKDRWHGTAILLGQPSEETIDGAKAMLSDGLYDRFPRPDFILGLHDSNDYPAGTIAIGPGPVLASATSLKVVFHGVGVHGSQPADGKDPIVMAAEFVMMAQTIVSRQISTLSPAVLTIGTFHAGTKNNIIPDDAILSLSMRSYSDAVTAKLLNGVKRTANGIASAYGVAPGRMPEITIFQSTPPTINDAALAERMRKVAVAELGSSSVVSENPIMASEDVGLFNLDGKIPAAFFFVGAVDPKKLEAATRAGVKLPGLHSALFAPVYDPTIRTGVTAMTAMAMSLLQH